MKPTNELQAIAELIAVLQTAETQQAKRVGLTVGALRVLCRVYALTSAGALLNGADVGRSWKSANADLTIHAGVLRENGYLVRDGTVKKGYWKVTRKGIRLLEALNRAIDRAREQLMGFEKVSPYYRIKPLE